MRCATIVRYELAYYVSSACLVRWLCAWRATISESFKGIIGKHPEEDKKELILHPEVADRWQEWPVTGLPREERDELLKDYPRRGKCNLEAPKLNPEVESFIGENTNDSRRDKGFADTQEKVGVALSAIGQAISSILDAGEAVDKDLLSTRLWDAAMLKGEPVILRPSSKLLTLNSRCHPLAAELALVAGRVS
ncbi:hypothetical protein QAD02_018712 [Eretmocerus hayati]|uniref:Uncharacterized protein n=1 Tax=Eretmocerus hayati TaxID=131215 RepID=A0ACC2PMB9_9HYME|nr:hypothetical protein QAD02_018712 [Eretmocerus hayati]